MKGLLAVFLLIFTSVSVFGQGEEVGPLTGNPDLYGTKSKKNILKANPGTFDSTFIYKSDTLSLPFFDEFSENHFQVFDADYTDPGVTFDKKYRILDNTTLAPIANDLYFTDQQTFRRVYDIVTSTYTDVNFDSTLYKVGDLSEYPVVYSTMELYPPYYIYDTVGVPDVSDTIWIVNPEFYQDSATQFFAVLNDANAYWLDNQAYHNYRFAVEPRSLGVVTFDGLDETGYPYLINSSATNYADFLTSKPLDLSGLAADDSVYFSFLYQAQGFGDIPESSDSLVLEFYAKDLDQWNRVWSTSGEAVTDFKVGHILLEDPIYFKKGYQFRFKNYGALSGMLDHFHIDYVHLRTLSGAPDTLFKDFAFVYPVGSLLKTYTSVPWDHFKNNPVGKMNDSTEIVVHNGSVLTENNQDGVIEVYYNSTFEGSYVMNGQTLSGGDINYAPRTTYYSYYDLSGGYVYDNTKVGNKQTFDIYAKAHAQFLNLEVNDSTHGIQYFGNYYSYDDGTAEAAYGPMGVQSRLAIKYEAYEPDSLLGVYIHFVPSVTDVSNKLFLLTVWDDNGGEPGNVIYEDDVFFPRQPEYAMTRNEFIPYYFLDTAKLSVGTTFYVGWRQFDSDRLNVGLDKNLDHSENTFYSIDGGNNWIPSSISGSVMIRPIFSTSMDNELITEEIAQEPKVKIYPNPTNDIINIEMEDGNFTGVEVYNMQGLLILDSTEPRISLGEQSSGLYFIRIKGIDGMFKVMKH